jgi:hypothetical protein
MKTLYESLLDDEEELLDKDLDIDIFDLILKSKNREEFNNRLDILESMGEEWPYPGDVLNKKDVYFYVVTNTMGSRSQDVFKHVRIGCNGKAYILKYYVGKPEISHGEPWKIMLQDDEKLRLPKKYEKYFKKHFR